MTDNPGLSEQRALIERLRKQARSESEAHRMFAEAKSLRQGDCDPPRADLYMWAKPEQTDSWKAADLLEAAFAQPPASAVDREGAFKQIADNIRSFASHAPLGRYEVLQMASEVEALALTNSGAPVPGDGDLRESAAAVWREAYIAVYGCEPTHSKEAYQAAYDVIAAALAHAAPAPPDVPEAIMRHCLQEAANNTGSPAAMLAAAPKQATPTDVEGGGGNPRKRS